MSASGKGRSFLLLSGVLLVTLGITFVLFTSFHSLAYWVVKLWPVFFILAGLAQLARFAIERKPRSPLWGALLIAVGGMLLAAHLSPALNLLQLYAKYWPLLLIVFAITQLVRYYTHRPSDGPSPRLFSFFRVVVLLLIVGSGVIAARLSASGGGAISLKLPRYVGNLSGSKYTFTDPAVLDSGVGPGARISISNKSGDIEIVGGGQGLKAVLTKRIRAWSESDAREMASAVQLIVERTIEGIHVTASPEQPGNDLTTAIQIEVPQSVSVTVESGGGKVSVNRTQGRVTVRGDRSQVNLVGISGDVDVTGDGSEVEAQRVAGSVTLAGPKRVRVSQVSGSVDISARNGSIDLRGVTGDVEIVAPFSHIIAEALSGTARINAEHSDVKISHAREVEIIAPRSDVHADSVSKRLQISSSHGNIRLRSIDGELSVSGERSEVEAHETRGPVNIETSHAEVSIKNFYDSVRVRTSYRDVKLISEREPAAGVDVETNHGEIRLTVPSNSAFVLEASSAGGKVRSVGFDSFPMTVGESVTFPLGTGGPRIRLKTSFKNIVIQSNGPVRTATTTVPKTS